MMRTRSIAMALAGGLVCGVFAAAVEAQITTRDGRIPGDRRMVAPRAVPAQKRPERATLEKMFRPVTVSLNDTRLEDVMTFVAELTGADIQVLWRTDRAEGLDREQLITIEANELPALTFIERVLARVETDFSQATWQMGKYGELYVGPKERLNKSKRLKIYSIQDLLTVLPTYDQVPQIDLQSVLQQGGEGGGGGGQSPFEDNQDDDFERRPMSERAQELVEIITELVEPDQWEARGGTGGSIRYWQGNLIVRAPDYMHRQLVGYPYWPSTSRKVSMSNGRRWVSLTADPSIGSVDAIRRTKPEPGGGG